MSKRFNLKANKIAIQSKFFLAIMSHATQKLLEGLIMDIGDHWTINCTNTLKRGKILVIDGTGLLILR